MTLAENHHDISKYRNVWTFILLPPIIWIVDIPIIRNINIPTHHSYFPNIHSVRVSKVLICSQSQKGLTCYVLLCSQTRPTIPGSPWQVSQGSSSVIAASSFITGIIRCTFNKPWSQIGILSYASINNGWIGEHYLLLFGSQMSNKSLETVNVCEVKYQQ